MILEILIGGFSALFIVSLALGMTYIIIELRRKFLIKKLNELHHRKMQILDEVKKELEVEALQKEDEPAVLEVYPEEEVKE